MPRLQAAQARALALDWSSGSLELRATEFQALVIGTAYQMGKLQGTVSRVDSGGATETLVIDPRPFGSGASEPRRVAAATLYRSLSLLARGAQQSAPVETWAPAPAETGGLPALVTIAVVVVGGAAIAYLGNQAVKVVDRYIERDQQSQRLVQTHVAAQTLVEAHTDREDEQGKQLPLDAATREALRALAVEQETIAKTTLPPLSGDILPSASPLTSLATGALVALAAVAGLWLANRTGVI